MVNHGESYDCWDEPLQHQTIFFLCNPLFFGQEPPFLSWNHTKNDTLKQHVDNIKPSNHLFNGTDFSWLGYAWVLVAAVEGDGFVCQKFPSKTGQQFSECPGWCGWGWTKLWWTCVQSATIPTRWYPPSYVCWVIIPMNTIHTTSINPNVIGLINQLS